MLQQLGEAAAPLLRKAPALAALLLLTVLAASPPALATSVRRLRLEEIIDASETIVQGRVESTRTFWQGRQIYTEVRVRVFRGLKGPRLDRLSFLQVGGRVEGPVPLEMTVPGAVTYRAGDEAYFFLEPGHPGERIVVGLFQGRVPLRRDAQGEYVGAPGPRRTPAQFEEEIRRHMAGQKPDKAPATP